MPEPVKARGNPFWPIPTRYVFAIHAAVGMAIVYGLKVCMTVALVGMVNSTAINEMTADENLDLPPDECAANEDKTVGAAAAEDGPFIWDADQQGLMLSSYFWGYMVALLPGGRMSEKYSAKWVMFFSVITNVVCILLKPPLARISWILVIVLRVIEGLGGGVTFPACHVMLSKWAPPNERSIMSSITYSGTSLGTVISTLGAGFLSENFGWESIFYVFGGLSALWLFFWTIFIFDSPNQQPFIRQEERDMINESLGIVEKRDEKPVGKQADKQAEKQVEKHNNDSIPWKLLLKSMPFWAVFVAHVCSNWGWYMILIELPFYMKQVLKFKLSENATRVAIPYLTLWVFSIALSKTLDKLRSKGIITTTTARKIATLIASVIPGGCLVVLCFSGCDRDIATIMVTVATTSMGAMFCGFLSNHIDLAPNHAGTLVAITNTVATIPGIVVPIFVGRLTHSDPTIASWRIIFSVTIVLFGIQAVFYTIFGSGEEQPWNKPVRNEHEMEKQGELQPLRE